MSSVGSGLGRSSAVMVVAVVDEMVGEGGVFLGFCSDSNNCSSTLPRWLS